MCRIYARIADSECRPVTRSVRLGGHVTSIRLEAHFWRIVDAMAEREGVATPRFLATLHDEVLELQGAVHNFASLLRVACTRFLESGGAVRAEAAIALERDRRDRLSA